MSARLAITMTLTAFLAVFAIAFINGINNLGVASCRFISPNAIRGMAIEHQGLVYTLNFNQQNDLAEAFNLAIPSTTNIEVLTNSPVSKVVIYRFNASDIYVELLGFSDNSEHSQILVFKNHEWFPGMLSTHVPKDYSSMLSNTYDHYSPQTL
jgi:hypothetical protein